MEFKEYTHINYSDKPKFMEYIRKNGADQGLFYVTPKIHGSNFSLITDGVKVREAKKSSIIGISEDHLGSITIVERLRECVLRLFSEMQRGTPAIKTIQVYGELFGGTYPHPDVLKNGKLKKIQKGVFYSPNNERLAYDIKVNGGRFVDAEEKYELFNNFDVPYIKPVFEGTFDECLKHSNEFQDPIHEYFNLPTIEDNICEGVVITPVREIVIGHSRIILKSKNEKWREKANKRKREGSSKIPTVHGPDLVRAIEEVSLYVTENRWLNVLSHEGEFKDRRQFGSMIKAFSKDVMDDFEDDNEELLYVLGNAERRVVNKTVSRLTAKIIKEYIPESKDD